MSRPSLQAVVERQGLRCSDCGIHGPVGYLLPAKAGSEAIRLRCPECVEESECEVVDMNRSAARAERRRRKRRHVEAQKSTMRDLWPDES